MKIAYKHLINFIPSKPSIDDISNKFFQLDMSMKFMEGIFDMEITPNRGDCLIHKWFIARFGGIFMKL